MKTVFEHIRTHTLQQAGYFIANTIPDLEILKVTEWSKKFEKLMRNRLLMGRFRYNSCLTDGKKNKYDSIGSIIKRAKEYKKTGNDELLVDIANIAMVEFEKGTHPHKHFHATDDGEHAELLDEAL
jgi:hypothetical protein